MQTLGWSKIRAAGVARWLDVVVVGSFGSCGGGRAGGDVLGASLVLTWFSCWSESEKFGWVRLSLCPVPVTGGGGSGDELSKTQEDLDSSIWKVKESTRSA